MRHLDQRQRDRDDDGPEDEAEDAEDLKAAKHAEEDQQFV
jgi:hypothetical protein